MAVGVIPSARVVEPPESISYIPLANTPHSGPPVPPGPSVQGGGVAANILKILAENAPLNTAESTSYGTNIPTAEIPSSNFFDRSSSVVVIQIPPSDENLGKKGKAHKKKHKSLPPVITAESSAVVQRRMQTKAQTHPVQENLVAADIENGVNSITPTRYFPSELSDNDPTEDTVPTAVIINPDGTSFFYNQDRRFVEHQPSYVKYNKEAGCAIRRVYIASILNGLSSGAATIIGVGVVKDVHSSWSVIPAVVSFFSLADVFFSQYKAHNMLVHRHRDKRGFIYIPKNEERLQKINFVFLNILGVIFTLLATAAAIYSIGKDFLGW